MLTWTSQWTSWTNGARIVASCTFLMTSTVRGGLYQVSLCDAGSWICLEIHNLFKGCERVKSVNPIYFQCYSICWKIHSIFYIIVCVVEQDSCVWVTQGHKMSLWLRRNVTNEVIIFILANLHRLICKRWAHTSFYFELITVTIAANSTAKTAVISVRIVNFFFISECIFSYHRIFL